MSPIFLSVKREPDIFSEKLNVVGVHVCDHLMLLFPTLPEEELEGLPQGGFGSIISNRRIQRVVSGVLHNPAPLYAT